jgi:hypothetical protein
MARTHESANLSGPFATVNCQLPDRHLLATAYDASIGACLPSASRWLWMDT